MRCKGSKMAGLNSGTVFKSIEVLIAEIYCKKVPTFIKSAIIFTLALTFFWFVYMKVTLFILTKRHLFTCLFEYKTILKWLC